MANYTCLPGYTLSGENLLTCQLDKTWTPSLPTCVACVTLKDPFSGHVSLKTDDFVTMATYGCVTGYSRVGVETRTCQTDGMWDTSEPRCDCENPASPSHGSVTVSGSKSTYTCDLNYSLSGPRERTCQTNGTGWSGEDPICSQCGTLVSPLTGVYTITTNGTQTSASLACNIGNSLLGNVIITCQADGSWGSLPTCVQCETLRLPTSGSITMSSAGNYTVATYACSVGYDLNGATSRECTSTGTWTLSAPTCTCQSPVVPLNGHVTDDGDTATYSCDLGYSLSGASVRTCSVDGSGWSGSDPTCTPCNTLTTPTGGTVTLTTDNLQTRASHTCDVGYTLNGLSSITCRGDGTWDFSQPQCSLCPTVSDPSSGSVTLTTNNHTTTASFACSSGYYISGSLTITCRTDGDWSNNAPTCKCNFPPRPTNGTVSVSDTSLGPVASYTCSKEYSIDGPSTRLCLADGTGWDSSDPACNLCSTITTPPEMHFTTSTNGTTTNGVYTCTVNYTLNGASVHVCQADGMWNTAQPSCVPCQAKHNPLSGKVALTTDGLTTVSTFTCVSGYSVNSTSITTCQTDGSWDLPDPACVCNPPSAVINGAIELTDDGRVANYTCDVNYELVGTQIRECLDDGTGWTGIQPICDLIVTEPPTPAASTDISVLSLPLGVLVAFIAVIVILGVALIICTYLRCRKDNQKVGATFEEGETALPIEEETKPETSKSVANGKAHLLGKATDKKPNFDVKNLKKTTSASDIAVTARTPPASAKHNGISENIPVTSVRLPKLPSKPPQGHHLRTNKRTRKPRKDVTPRTSTPIEIQMSRSETPVILSTAEFDYIHPVYCHEVETPSSSRPTTREESNRHLTALSADDGDFTNTLLTS